MTASLSYLFNALCVPMPFSVPKSVTEWWSMPLLSNMLSKLPRQRPGRPPTNCAIFSCIVQVLQQTPVGPSLLGGGRKIH